MKRILFVDDEVNVLEGLQRMLRPLRKEWEMVFAKSGADALAEMAKKPFDVIVSDMRMPVMDGIALLGRVAQLYPDTIRFVLSGQCDRETIFRSVGIAHQFMAKPCESELVVNTISRAFALRDLLKTDELKALVTKIRVLPSLPELYVQVVQELRSPDASTQRVGNLIAQDLAMSAKVLQLVNSAFFGPRQRVNHPAQAASLLGLDILKSLVLIVGVFSSLDVSGVPGFGVEGLWRHSLFVGRFAQAIAHRENAHKTLVQSAFTAGLFHDLGQYVLVANVPTLYRDVVRCATEENLALVDAEKKVLNATHCDVGAYLLGLWGFGDPIVEACAYHHYPSRCLSTSFDSVTAVHVANVIDHELRSSRQAVMDEPYLSAVGVMDRLPAWRAMAPTVGDGTGGETSDGTNSVRG